VEKIKSYEHSDLEKIANQNASGLGTLLINKFADLVSYSNRGKEGQFVHVEKYLPYTAVSETSNAPDTKAVEAISDFKFYIRRLKPEEAYSISQLAYYTYNVSYIYDKIYYPEVVRKLNEEGEMVSVVAVNEANEEIIGHVAAIRHELSGMPEMAVAFVSPKYRGGGCLQKGSEFLLNELKESGSDVVIVHAVTVHPYSQKAAYKLNLRETALYVSRITPLEMNEINDENQVRDSLLLMSLSFKNKEVKDVFAPEHHAKMISGIYKNIGLPVNIITKES
jgi:serine/threonine-protein kinase RsbW